MKKVVIMVVKVFGIEVPEDIDDKTLTDNFPNYGNSIPYSVRQRLEKPEYFGEEISSKPYFIEIRKPSRFPKPKYLEIFEGMFIDPEKIVSFRVNVNHLEEVYEMEISFDNGDTMTSDDADEIYEALRKLGIKEKDEGLALSLEIDHDRLIIRSGNQEKILENQESIKDFLSKIPEDFLENKERFKDGQKSGNVSWLPF